MCLAGWGSWLDSPAYWTVAGTTPTILRSFSLTKTSTVDGFIIETGCSSIYEAMAAALGPDRVLLKARFNVRRQRNAVRVDITAGTKWSTGGAVAGAAQPGWTLAAVQAVVF